MSARNWPPRACGAHIGDPAEIAALRGPKKRAKSDHADAQLLRTLLSEGRFPESWIPPAHVVETRILGRLYCRLMDERRSWPDYAYYCQVAARKDGKRPPWRWNAKCCAAAITPCASSAMPRSPDPTPSAKQPDNRR